LFFTVYSLGLLFFKIILDDTNDCFFFIIQYRFLLNILGHEKHALLLVHAEEFEEVSSERGDVDSGDAARRHVHGERRGAKEIADSNVSG
jgi:hypothetical protein